MREIIDLRQLREMNAHAAAALLSARMSDEVTDQDRETLHEWLALDETNRKAWLETEWALGLVDAAGEDADFRQMLEEARLAGPSKSLPWPRWAAAAAVVLAVMIGIASLGGGAGWWNPGKSPEEQIATNGAGAGEAVSYATARGERRSVKLADGSQMTLDAESSIKVSYTRDHRFFELLRGRAFFTVKHDPTKPFTVRANDRSVTALGTKFDVRLAPSLFQVKLVEGRVGVMVPGAKAQVVLTAGQQLTQRENAAPSVSHFEEKEVQDWQEGLITFRNDTLADAIAVLNHYSADQIIVRDPSLANLRISGTFKTGDGARFARAIAAMYPIRIRRAGNHTIEMVRAH